MVRKLSMLAVMALLVSNMTYANTSKPATIMIDNKKIETDVAPEIKRDVTFVPISVIAKQLNATIKWDNPYVTIAKDDVELVFELGKLNVFRNDEKYSLEEAPYLLNGRIMIPLRTLSEQLGCAIKFDNKLKRIDINSQENTYFSVPVDTRRYNLSADEKWGLSFKEHYVTNEEFSELDPILMHCGYTKLQTTYLKNMKTNDVVEIYTGVGVISQWLDQDRVLFASKSGNIQDDEIQYDAFYQLDIYNVETEQYETIAENVVFYKVLSDQKIGFEFKNNFNQTEYRVYEIETAQTLEITETEYDALLK